MNKINIIFKNEQTKLEIDMQKIGYIVSIAKLELLFKNYSTHSEDGCIFMEKYSNEGWLDRVLKVIPRYNRIFIHTPLLKEDKIKIYLENQEQTVDILAIQNLVSLSSETVTMDLDEWSITWIDEDWIKIEPRYYKGTWVKLENGLRDNK